MVHMSLLEDRERPILWRSCSAGIKVRIYESIQQVIEPETASKPQMLRTDQVKPCFLLLNGRPGRRRSLLRVL